YRRWLSPCLKDTSTTREYGRSQRHYACSRTLPTAPTQLARLLPASSMCPVSLGSMQGWSTRSIESAFATREACARFFYCAQGCHGVSEPPTFGRETPL